MSLFNLDLLAEAFKEEPKKAPKKKAPAKKEPKGEHDKAIDDAREKRDERDAECKGKKGKCKADLDTEHDEHSKKHKKLTKERDRHAKTHGDAAAAYGETPEGKEKKRPGKRSHPDTTAAWDAFSGAEGDLDDHDAEIDNTAASARRTDFQRETGREWSHDHHPHGSADDLSVDLPRVHKQLKRAGHADHEHVAKHIKKKKSQKESLGESIDLFRRL
jgi:hypothetical protein